MNDKNLKRFCFISAFSLLTAVNGCSLKSDKQILNNTNVDGIQSTVQDQTLDQRTQTKDNTQDSKVITKNNLSSADAKDNGGETVERAATKEVPIYSINQDTQSVESVVALVPQDSKVTPELILDLVTDSLADRLIMIGADTVNVQQDTVIVSFKSDQQPVVNTDSSLEKAILDAIAQSLVDNLKDYPKVIFRIKGQAYKSDHYSFGLNEVYLDNSKSK
jgi:hypothetical protein